MSFLFAYFVAGGSACLSFYNLGMLEAAKEQAKLAKIDCSENVLILSFCLGWLLVWPIMLVQMAARMMGGKSPW
jgi:hypothetical protein